MPSLAEINDSQPLQKVEVNHRLDHLDVDKEESTVNLQ